MEKVKNMQNKKQQRRLLRECIRIKVDLQQELKNILNKDNQYTIPIFIPHKGCPNECVFCNQRKITGLCNNVKLDEVERDIQRYIEYFKNKPKEKKVEIAFFGGSFTGIPINEQVEYLELANKYISLGKIDSIRISTRPDYISPKILKMLKKYNVGTIELGVQSMDNNVLITSKRGHLASDVVRASRLITMYGIRLGHQVMIGLPNSNIDTELYTIEQIIKLKPSQLRIYPVYVLENSELYDMYESGVYKPLSLDEAIERTYKVMLECQNTNMQIIRIGLQSTDEITASNSKIIGPVCDNFAEYVLAKLVLAKLEYEIQNCLRNINREDREICVELEVLRRYISIVTGPKRVNTNYLQDKYDIILKVKGEQDEKSNICS